MNQYNYDETFVYIVYPNNINLGYSEITNKEKNDFDNNYFINVPYEKWNFSPLFKLVEGKNYLIKNFLMYDNEIISTNKNSDKFNLDIQSLIPYLSKKPNCLKTIEICSINPIKKSNELTIETSINFNKKIKEQ